MRCVLIGLVVISACGEVTSRPSDASIDGNTGPATVTFTNQLNDGQPANVDLVAFQDGDGPWQVATGVAGAYTTTVTSGRFGVLWACKRASDGSAFVNLGYYAVSDGKARYAVSFCASSAPPRVMISGTVAGAMTGDQIFISDGVSSSQGPPANWTLQAAAGAGTLIAMRLSNSRPVGMLLQHVQYAAGATFSLDFTQQFFPAESDLTEDPTAGAPVMTTWYRDETGGTHRIDVSTTAVNKYRVVPADRVGNGVSMLYASGSAANASRSIQRAFKNPVAQTMTLPATYLLPTAPRVTATMPYPIVEVALPRRAGASFYEVNYGAFPAMGKFQIWDVVYSAAWADAAGGTAIASKLPDLSTLPGWLADFGLGLTAATTRTWSATVATGPARLLPGSSMYVSAGVSSAQPADGDETTTSTANGTFGP
jgi:hypothetical protein